jgi:hypothetical protein
MRAVQGVRSSRGRRTGLYGVVSCKPSPEGGNSFVLDKHPRIEVRRVAITAKYPPFWNFWMGTLLAEIQPPSLFLFATQL